MQNIPEGWKPVPRTPDKCQIEEALYNINRKRNSQHEISESDLIEVYENMVWAAPTPQPQEQPSRVDVKAALDDVMSKRKNALEPETDSFAWAKPAQEQQKDVEPVAQTAAWLVEYEDYSPSGKGVEKLVTLHDPIHECDNIILIEPLFKFPPTAEQAARWALKEAAKVLEKHGYKDDFMYGMTLSILPTPPDMVTMTRGDLEECVRNTVLQVYDDWDSSDPEQLMKHVRSQVARVMEQMK